MIREPRHVPAEATSLMDMARRLSSYQSDDYRELTEGPGEVIQGVVLDAFAHMNSYFIAAPRMSVTPAFLASGDSSLLPIGVKNHSMMMPGTSIVAWMPANHDWAVILGTRGGALTSRNLALPYSIVPASRVGIFDDVVHNLLPFSDLDSTGVINSSSGRPVDALPGEWGVSNEFGLMLHVGRAMAMLKASETAGLFVYWLDNLVRLWSYNYEHFTAGSERYAYNDEGEFTDRGGSTPFPWEALGSFGPLAGQNTTVVKTLEDGAIRSAQEDLAVEPSRRDQAPIWRRLWFDGFLGGMKREIIQAPRVPSDDQPEALGRAAVYPGLLEVHYGLNGSYALRSAKEITLEKTILIPAPKQKKLPADPLGDHKDGFSAGGLRWSREDNGTTVQTPEVPDLKEFEFTGEIGARIGQLMEYHSYLFNVYNVAGFRLHPKDWKLPDEGEIEPTDQEFQGSINDDVVPPAGNDYFMPLPKVGELIIDHRTRARYYKSRSIIKQFDDGSVLIEDGWGSQIRMEGGSVFITAPLDVVLQPGRSLVGMAPNDVIMRAGNSLDATAAKGDLRLKAERNLHVLAGNSGQGGLLLESRGTGAPSFGVGEDMRDGGITIKTNGDIRVSGSKVGIKSLQDLLLTTGGNLRISATELLANATFSRFSGSLAASSLLTALFNGVSAVLLTDSNGDTVVGLAYAGEALLNQSATAAQDGSLTGEVANAEFTLRTPEQYQLEDGTFIWYESRWQQYYRRNLSETQQKTWDEPTVVAKGTATRPYPGNSLWQTAPVFRQTDHQLFDLENGRSKPFQDLDGEDKEQAADPVRTSLAASYLITKQGRP